MFVKKLTLILILILKTITEMTILIITWGCIIAYMALEHLEESINNSIKIEEKDLEI